MPEDELPCSVPDLEVDGGYMSPIFSNETDQQGGKIAVLRDARIVIHDSVLSDGSDILPLLEYAVQFRKSLLFIGGGVKDDALQLLVINAHAGRRPFAAVRISGCQTSPLLVMDDIAVATGGMVLNEDLGYGVRHLATLRRIDLVLGSAKVVRIDKAKTAIFGGAGTNRASIASPAVSPRRGSGRPAKYNWPPILAKLRKELEHYGVPADGDGGQALLENFVTSLFLPERCPAASTIRGKVRQEMENLRRDLNQ
jgi:hypothetical protein